jgi:hypothetical protein
VLNHIEEVKDESKEDMPIVIYMDNISAVDLRITFKNNNHAMHTLRTFHFVKQRFQDVWHTFVWIIDQSMVADNTTPLQKCWPLRKSY